jgi:hypothetical protein
MFASDEERKLNPMDFEKRFAEIMSNGGFDAIVGNPPYFSISTLEANQQNYFKLNYKNSDKISDIYCLFYEKAIKLLKSKGLLSFITSSQWLQTNYGKTLRKFFIDYSNPIELLNFGGIKIFKNATVDTTILKICKEEFKNNLRAFTFDSKIKTLNNVDYIINNNFTYLDNLKENKWIIITNKDRDLKEKIKSKSEPLKEKNITIHYGIKTGLNEAFIINTNLKNQLCSLDKYSEDIIRPVLRGRDTHKFYYEWANLWLIVSKNGIDIKNYSAIYEHLKSFSNKIKNRADKGDNWWNLRACSYYGLFDSEKIIYPETSARRSEFVLDTNKMFIDKTCFMITGQDLKFLNGILTSKITEWYLETELRKLGKIGIQYSKQFVLETPIPKINFQKETEKQSHDRIVSLVDQMLETKKQLQSLKTDRDKTYYENKCKDLNQVIDSEVYKLYGLSEEEIRIVEGKNNGS